MRISFRNTSRDLLDPCMHASQGANSQLSACNEQTILISTSQLHCLISRQPHTWLRISSSHHLSTVHQLLDPSSRMVAKP
jgi:hypothetical protein